MRCLVCHSLSFKLICKDCLKRWFTPSFFERSIGNNFKVYSFYEYSHIKEFINLKYKKYGSFVLKLIAKESFKKFANEFKYTNKLFAIPIDDNPINGFSHTAILANELKSNYIKPLFNSLKARNRISYAGKDYQFRLNNPRDFIYCGKTGIDVILVDDIITTGLTMIEAYSVLKKADTNPLFGLVLADAKL